MGQKNGKLYQQLRTAFQQEGDHEALNTARACSNLNTICRWVIKSACLVILRNWKADSARASSVINQTSKDARFGMDKKCPSPTITQLACVIRQHK